ncbi:MAG TPA: hypothetical protein PKI03_04525 [Pseudomonadota bacterium]|nr:hypothetical protein [Pseudomonadota bacterium]
MAIIALNSGKAKQYAAIITGLQYVHFEINFSFREKRKRKQSEANFSKNQRHVEVVAPRSCLYADFVSAHGSDLLQHEISHPAISLNLLTSAIAKRPTRVG